MLHSADVQRVHPNGRPDQWRAPWDETMWARHRAEERQRPRSPDAPGPSAPILAPAIARFDRREEFEQEARRSTDTRPGQLEPLTAADVLRLCREYCLTMAGVTTGGVTQTIRATLVELDFGSPGTRQRTFVVVDPAVTAQTNVVMSQSALAAIGRSADENELDAFVCRCTPVAGSFTAFITTVDGGSVSGLYKFQYLLA